MSIDTLINDPGQLDRKTLQELRALVEEFPFYQAARLLYVANLYAVHDRTFGEELRRGSVLVPDRRALFQLIEGRHYTVDRLAEAAEPEQLITTEGDDRTTTLIDNFLQGLPADKTDGQEPHSVPTVADVTSDYAAFLAMQDDLPAANSTSAETPGLKGADLIDNFINETKGKQRYEMVEPDSDEALYDPLRELTQDTEEDVYNENIVNMLIKQGQYEQGLEILRRICLNNPEKSRTFATQMHLLEVIVEKNKS